MPDSTTTGQTDTNDPERDKLMQQEQIVRKPTILSDVAERAAERKLARLGQSGTLADILNDPDVYARMCQTARKATKKKLARNGAFNPIEVNEAVPEVVSMMGVFLLESPELLVAVQSGGSLATVANRAASAWKRFNTDTMTKMRQRGARSDQSRNVPGWEKLPALAQVAAAEALTTSWHISVDHYTMCLKRQNWAAAARIVEKAQSVLSAHTLINIPGRGSPVRITRITDREYLPGAIRLNKYNQPILPGFAWNGEEAAEYRQIPHEETQPDGTVNVTFETRKYPKVDTLGARSRNLGSVFYPIIEARIVSTGPVSEVMEYTTHTAHSAETVWFRDIRSKVVGSWMSDLVCAMSLFQYETVSDGINYAEAYRVLKKVEPTPKERMAFMRLIRAQAEYQGWKAQNELEGIYRPKNTMPDFKYDMWKNRTQGCPDAQKVQPTTTFRERLILPFMPEENVRPESAIQAEIAQIRPVVYELFQTMTDWTDRPQGFKLDDVIQTLHEGRKYLDRLGKELMG